MPRKLARWSLVPLLGAMACGQSDSETYSTALLETESYSASLASCGDIDDDELRDDCRVAIMEIWSRLDPADCDIVESLLWKDECYFLLGERQWQGGDLSLGLRTCEQSRFRRNCAWHLIQDEVQASLDMSAIEAEERIMGFVDARAVPDAAMQFWTIRFREQAGEGRALDAADCEGLRDSIACRAAVERHILAILDAQSTRDPEALCSSPRGQRASLNGQPAWLDDAVTGQAESLWVRTRCEGQTEEARGSSE